MLLKADLTQSETNPSKKAEITENDTIMVEIDEEINDEWTTLLNIDTLAIDSKGLSLSHQMILFQYCLICHLILFDKLKVRLLAPSVYRIIYRA